MADFLYNRISRRMRWAAMMAFAAVYLSILGAIGYVIFHFVVKFW